MKIKNLKLKFNKNNISFNDLEKISTALKDRNGSIKLIGGCVRDIILNNESNNEIDLVTDLKPDDVIFCLEKNNIKFLKIGYKFGCITIILEKNTIEITSLRKDLQYSGRWPVVEYTNNWIEDAKRRDFSLNAIYLDLNGCIFDPLNGFEDLLNKKIKFIGSTEVRIKEDYLRILRFIRFNLLYKKKLNLRNKKFFKKYRNKIKNLSFERRYSEIKKILEIENFHLSVADLNEINFFDEVFGVKVFKKCAENYFLIEKNLQMRSTLRNIKFFFQKKNKTPRFASVFSRKDQKRVFNKLKIKKYDLQSLKKKIYFEGKDNVFDQLIFNSAKKHLSFAELKGLFLKLNGWKPQQFPLSGFDLKKLGIQNGLLIGKILKKTELWWVNKNFLPSKKECLKQAKKSLPA